MNEITMKLVADKLIMQALEERYYKRGHHYQCGDERTA